MKKRVYFDNAATTPIEKKVMARMVEVMQTCFGNPSSIHAEGRQARAIIEDARKTIAQAIGSSIGEIFFTSGGTESNNWALKGAVRDLSIRRIISSPTEHHSVRHTLEVLRARHGIEVVFLEVDAQGHIDYQQLEHLLAHSSAPTLVSLMHANNEIGTMIELERVSELCRQYGALLHSDTVQTIGHYPFDLSKMRINFLSGSAHKFHGPKGVGFLYIHSDNFIRPLIDGGAQERNMRGGTENIYGIAGMATALESAVADMEARRTQIELVRSYFAERLKEAFDDIHFNGDWQEGLYTVLNVSFPPSKKSEMLLMLLDIAGVSASSGSACSSGAETRSHVLQAIQADPRRRAIRFSFSHLNTREEVDFVIDQLKTMLPTRTPAT